MPTVDCPNPAGEHSPIGAISHLRPGCAAAGCNSLKKSADSAVAAADGTLALDAITVAKLTPTVNKCVDGELRAKVLAELQK